MRKIIPFIFSLILLLIIAGGWFFFKEYLPARIRSDAGTFMQGSGFDLATLPEPEITYDGILYRDVALDPDRFSTAEEIKILFDPVKFITEKQANALEVTGLNLTGEMDKNGNVTVSGWSSEQSRFQDVLARFKTVNVRDSYISVLTEKLGGLTFEYSLQVRKGNPDYEIQGFIKSAQKHMTFVSNFGGTMDSAGTWMINADIEQAKLELPLVRASRLMGKLAFKGTQDAPTTVAGEFQAGGLALYTLPWQNAKGGINGTLDHFTIMTDAHSLGHDGIMLSLIAEKRPERIEANGTVKTQSLVSLLSYMSQHNGPLPADDRLAQKITDGDINDVELAFKVEGLNSLLGERIIYRMENRSAPGFSQGRIQLQRPK